MACELEPPKDKADFLGDGGFGAVYKQRVGDVERAVKYVSFKQPRNKKLFLQEAELYRIACPNPFVATLVESCTEGARGVLVMEMLDGGPLMTDDLKSSLYALGRTPPDVGETVLRKLLVGLEMMHRKGVYHRDIKPQNVMVGLDPAACGGFKVKFIDFGLACNSFDLCKVGGGTKRYWPPELWAPEFMMDQSAHSRVAARKQWAYYASRQDVWALAATVLYFVTRGGWDVVKDIEWLYRRKWEGDIVDRQEGVDRWPPALRCLLGKMLTPSPNARPSALDLLPSI